MQHRRERIARGSLQLGETQKEILSWIRREGKRGLTVKDLAGYTGFDLVSILETLTTLKKLNMIFVKNQHGESRVYSRREA